MGEGEGFNQTDIKYKLCRFTITMLYFTYLFGTFFSLPTRARVLYWACLVISMSGPLWSCLQVSVSESYICPIFRQYPPLLILRSGILQVDGFPVLDPAQEKIITLLNQTMFVLIYKYCKIQHSPGKLSVDYLLFSNSHNAMLIWHQVYPPFQLVQNLFHT